jgi:hypothetical protein
VLLYRRRGKTSLIPPEHTPCPEVLNLHWQNGTDTVNLALTNPEIVQAGSSVVRTKATIVGTPEYLRLSGNGTLNVNIGGNNETASTPAVWEVQYGH